MKNFIIIIFILLPSTYIYGMVPLHNRLPCGLRLHKLTPEKLTPEEIYHDFLQEHSSASQDSDDIDKNELLKMIIDNYDGSKEQTEIAIQLIQNGASAKIRCAMGESLLHKALLWNNKDLVHVLLANGADYNEVDYVYKKPIFFNAQTIDIVKLFINKGTNIHRLDGDNHNVLYHIIDPKYPVALMRFYLEQGLNVKHICKFDDSCILHDFAAYGGIKSEMNFVVKAWLILKVDPTLVNIRNVRGETPLMIAENSVRIYKEKVPFQKLIELIHSSKDKEVV